MNRTGASCAPLHFGEWLRAPSAGGRKTPPTLFRGVRSTSTKSRTGSRTCAQVRRCFVEFECDTTVHMYNKLTTRQTDKHDPRLVPRPPRPSYQVPRSKTPRPATGRHHRGIVALATDLFAFSSHSRRNCLRHTTRESCNHIPWVLGES